MIRPALLLILGAAALGLASSATPQPLPAVVGPAILRQPPPADPFPIRRTYLTGDALATALAHMTRGELVQLPRDDFEAKVRAAAHAAGPPRLADARYRATLTDAGLVGTAEWRLAAPAGGLLPLDSLRAAVCAAKWADGTDAHIVRAGQPVSAHLIVPPSSDTTLALNWSLRGTEEPTAEQYDLGFPAAPVAALELDLPADRVPALRTANQLLTGPFPGPAADRRVWRIVFGGQSRVELSVRRPLRDGEPGPAVHASRFARYDLAPGVATCTYEFEFEAVRGLLPTWTFETEPGLTVTAVTGPGRLSWRVDSKPDQPSRVVVTPQGLVAAGRVTVTGFAPVLAAATWTGPRVRFVEALPKGDSLEVRIDPDLKFAGCEPGDYRVVASGPADRGYRVALSATTASGIRRPPTFHVRPAEPELSVTEDVTWRLGLGKSDLTARFRGRVHRGPVTQLVVKVSPGLAVTGVRSVPDDADLTWAPQPEGVRIEPSRPLATGQAYEFTLDLRGPAMPMAPDSASPGGARMTMPFPQVSLAAAERDGTLTVVADPALAVWANPDPAGANFIYPYRGRSPDGTLTVAARTPQLTATSDTQLSLAGNELVSTTQFKVRVEEGAIGSVTVAVPETDGVRWAVQAEGTAGQRILGGEVIPLAGPWAAALPRMGFWRVPFPAERTGEFTLTVESKRPAPEGAIDIPLPCVLGATPSRGLFSVLPLRPRGDAPAPTTGWAFAGVELLARLVADDRIETVFSGTVTTANGPVLPVGLPDDAVVSAVLVAGKHVDHLLTTTRPEVAGRWLELPLPESREVRFEVRYTLPANAGTPFARVVSPTPRLPGDPSAVIRWSVAPEFRRWPHLDAPSEPTETESITIVKANLVVGIGYALAAVAVGVGVGFWFGRVRTRWRVSFAIGVAVLGVAAWTVPPGWLALVRPPLVVGLFVVAIATALAGQRPPEPRSTSRLLPTTISAAPLALLLMVWPAASAQAPEPVVVYVVPTADRLTVLAPQPVLDRLDALVRPHLPYTSILSAEYDGAAIGTSATLTATFRVLCTRAGDQVVNLPLTGVRLESLDLDGKPAFPDASRADRYAVTVRGIGQHVLTAKFVVPSAVVGAEREVRFGVPDVVCTKVRFAGPVDVATRRGTQTTTRDGDRVKVEADHGGGRMLAIRWRDGTETGTKPTVTVREACVWDLTEAGEAATAVFLFRVTGGSTARFAIEIPDGLEPTRPTVRTPDPRGPGLRDWRIDPAQAGWRKLTLQLQAPTEGLVTVAVRLYPKQSGGATPTLRFPRAIEVSQSESYFALRLDKVTTTDLPRVGVIDLTADALARDFGAVDELGAAPLDLVFRRAGTETPEVRPVLRSTAEAPTGFAETVWTCGPRAEAQGIVQSSRPGQTSFEFDLPAGVQLHSLRGPDLQAWGRIGSRVQVWLKKPTREVTVRWTGSVAEPLAELPFARLVGIGPATMKVRAADGWMIVPQQTRGLKPLSPARAVEELGFEADATAPPPRFAFLPPVVPSSVTITETVERAADGLRYRALIRVPLAPDRPHHFTLQLPGLPADAEAEIVGPPGTRIGPTWEVIAPPSAEPLLLTVAVRLPMGSPLPRPEVAFGGPPVAAMRTLTLGAGLTPTEPRTIVEAPPATDSVPALAPSPPNESTTTSDTGLSPELRDLAAALAWVAGFAFVLASARVGRSNAWPERLAGCGLLGAIVVGTTTLAGIVFLTLALIGGLGRLVWVIRRLARVVLR